MRMPVLALLGAACATATIREYAEGCPDCEEERAGCQPRPV